MKKLTKKQLLLQTETKHLLVFGCGVVVVCVVIWGLLAQATTPRQPQRLVTFYDRGIKRVILTQADTVYGALRFADITVDPNDAIEPSVGTKLTKTDEDIIIYRSRMINVVDGNIRQTVMTARQSPHEILQQAGLDTLGTKDTTTFQRASTFNGALIELVVSRAEPEKPAPVIFQSKPNALTRSKGAHVYVDGSGVAHRETYYDLPMNRTLESCGAGNSYTIRLEDGAKVDQDGYVLVAANLAAYPRCSIVDTSLGLGKVYDTGGFAVRHPYGFDLATDWTNGDGV